MVIVPSGKLTSEVITELKTCLDKEFPTEAIQWGMFEETEMSSFGGVPKADRQAVLTAINLQLAKTKAYIGGKNPTREACPFPDMLKTMIEKKASIRSLANLEYKIEEIRKDFSQLDLAKVVEVINWCRHFFTDPTMGVFYPLNAEVTVGGTITHGDKTDSTTTNTGAGNMPPAHAAAMRRVANMPKPTPPTKPTSPSGEGKTTFNFPGGLTGRVDASGEYIKIRGKDYDPTSEEHRGFAEKHGYDLVTGKKK